MTVHFPRIPQNIRADAPPVRNPSGVQTAAIPVINITTLHEQEWNPVPATPVLLCSSLLFPLKQSRDSNRNQHDGRKANQGGDRGLGAPCRLGPDARRPGDARGGTKGSVETGCNVSLPTQYAGG